jgi:hypothetical protein
MIFLARGNLWGRILFIGKIQRKTKENDQENFWGENLFGREGFLGLG